MSKKILGVVMIAALVFTGCAKPPEQEMTQADEAMQAATASQADVYAPAEAAAAKESFAKAHNEVEAQKSKFVLFRSYTDAKTFYAASIDAANAAKEAAIVNKEAVKNEAMALIGESKMVVDNADKALRTAPRGKDTRADLDAMKADVQSLQGMLPELDDLFSREMYMDAKNKAVSVKEKAAQIVADVQAAREKAGSKKHR